MSTPQPHLPSLDDAAALAKGVAAALSQMSGAPYGGPARAELIAGEGLVEAGLGNPVAFAHTVIDWYVQGTEDLLYGTGELSREQHDLALSSATVARSACEYAGIGYWLAEPDISVDRRIARTAHLVDRASREARGLLDGRDLTQYEVDHALLLGWARRQLSTMEKLPKPTERFKALNPERGRKHYTWLSMLAHGNLATTGQIVNDKVTGQSENVDEQLQRILLACSHGLGLAARIGTLRDRPSEYLPGPQNVHAHYSACIGR